VVVNHTKHEGEGSIRKLNQLSFSKAKRNSILRDQFCYQLETRVTDAIGFQIFIEYDPTREKLINLCQYQLEPYFKDKEDELHDQVDQAFMKALTGNLYVGNVNNETGYALPQWIMTTAGAFRLRLHDFLGGLAHEIIHCEQNYYGMWICDNKLENDDDDKDKQRFYDAVTETGALYTEIIYHIHSHNHNSKDFGSTLKQYFDKYMILKDLSEDPEFPQQELALKHIEHLEGITAFKNKEGDFVDIDDNILDKTPHWFSHF